ncbi:MAG TPA: hypothetical protein VHF24_09780 [Acidimicrobiales bacterium]|nr:hypothetical protein [Acidimicrobiales bacterium]
MAEGERADVGATPGPDDETLGAALAAVLGLSSEGSGSPVTTPRAVSVPPPRRPPYSPPSTDPVTVAAGGEQPSASDDFWGSGDELERLDARPAPSEEDGVPDVRLASAGEAPARPFAESSDADAVGSRLSAPSASDADDFWGEPETDESPPAPAEDEPEAPGLRPREVLPRDLWLRPADRDRDRAASPTPPVDRPEEPSESSLTALQEVGLGGPLNTAMGDLRRLADEGAHRGTEPVASEARGADDSHAQGVVPRRDRLRDRRRDLPLQLAVAALVVIAFAVVLLTRGGDSRRGIDTRVATSTPPTTAQAPAVPAADASTTSVPLPEEVMPPPPDAAAPPPSSASQADDGRPPAGARAPSRPRASRSPAPAAAPAPSRPAPEPTSPPATTATTQPPATTTPPASVPKQSGPCDRSWLSPEARQACLDSRGPGGDD